jgi:hypothetical protein
MNKVSKFIGRHRFLFGQGYGWVGVLGIPWLVARDLQALAKSHYGLQIPLFPLILLGIGGLWFAGWLVYALGLIQAAQEAQWEANPAYHKIMGKHGERGQ